MANEPMKVGDFAAFPIPNSDAPGSFYPELGMTKREYFAASALKGLLACPTFEAGPSRAAAAAVKYADALIAELSASPAPDTKVDPK